MAGSARRRGAGALALTVTVVSLAAGCNQVLGIREPLDEEWDGGGPSSTMPDRPDQGSPAGNGPHSGDPSDGGDGGGELAHAWAEWPMPNPPSTGLPNP